MTQIEAKELSLEKWRYLRDHPRILQKEELPKKIRDKIKSLKNWCPLCDLFYIPDPYVKCKDCPLETCATGSLYEVWQYSLPTARQKAAAKIVELVEAWEPK